MTEKESQAIAIAEKYVGYFTLEDIVRKLSEEMLELAMAIAKNDAANIDEEIGDVAFALLHMAYKVNPNKDVIEYITPSSEKMEKRKGMKQKHGVGFRLDLPKLAQSLKDALAKETAESIDAFFGKTEDDNIRPAYIYWDNGRYNAAIGVTKDNFFKGAFATSQRIPIPDRYSDYLAKHSKGNTYMQVELVVPEELAESDTKYFVAIPAREINSDD